MEQNHARKILDFTFRYLAETLAEGNKKQDSLAAQELKEKKKSRPVNEYPLMRPEKQ
jgi:hypothetical protein